MDKHTPTTDVVESAYVRQRASERRFFYDDRTRPRARAEFNRWLVAHDAEVKTEALREAANDLAGRDFLVLGTGLPRIVACDYLRTRAHRTAAEGGADRE